MASASVIGCLIEYYGTLSFSGKPAIYFDEVPLVGTTTADKIAPPYVVMHDDGMTPEFDFEFNVPFETTQVRLEVFATTLALLDAYIDGIKYNGAAINAAAGFDFAVLNTYTKGVWMATVRTREQRFQESPRAAAAGLIFRGRLQYEVKVQRTQP